MSFVRKTALIAGFLAAAAPALAQDSGRIRQIVVQGTQRIEVETVKSYMAVSEGDPYDSDRIDRSLKTLYNTGLFADIAIRREGDVVVVRVVENPIINRIAFEGNKRIKEEELTQESQLRPRVVYTRTKVQSDVKRILDLYRRNGRFGATVEPKIIQLEQNRVDLVFEINEGESTYVKRINFVGNHKYSDSRLREVLMTKEERWYRFFSTDDTYDPDRLTYDRELLRRYYLKHGYADFRVSSAVAELTPDRQGFFITMTVDEGDRYQFGPADITANLKDLNVEERLNDFDLVVFDRYRRRGVLAGAYYQALAAYVKRGGALLVASGAEFAEPGGLYDTPLAPILPTEPTGRVLEQGFVPHLTDLGRRHPVTAALIGNGHWGEWLRQVAAVPRRDTVTLMSGADGLPLLVLGKVGEGRVAQLLSDTIWLWARGYDGGGPHDEVLRRLAHWLMKEPELEEDSLSAEIKGNRLEVVRRSLAPPPPAITVTDPDGTRTTLPLSPLPDGRASAAATVERPGLYRIDDGERVAIAAVGSLAPLEESELAATAATLTPVATASGGSVRFLAEDGVPDFRKVGESRTASGRGWAGLVGRGDSTVSGVRETPLLPSLALMALALGALAAAWTREGR